MAFDNSLSYSWHSLVKQFSSVHATLPPAAHFKLPPSPLPRTLLPPSDHPTLAHPFTISPYWYNRLLSPQVPVTIALVYVTVVTLLNVVNQRRQFKPWAFSKTSFFKLMVITHNIILAVYSAWTFVGMVNALNASLEPPWAEYGLAGTVDSLCKINGPRGYGSAAAYNETTSAWGIANHLFHIGADGLGPDPTDVGRIWNEGLAFYGWLFYLSKYYEVIDTLIILAKGKKSSFLQTYHHAGAMLCMWAGIRYMSPPIWMFVLINSFIHTIMYTFYLCGALNIRVPVWFKRTLTTLQITQFVVGAGYAFAHLFVKYKSPVSVPYLYHLGSVASAAPSISSSVISTVTATASVDTASQVKKWLLRAAGREGLAENVLNRQGETFGVDAVHAAKDFAAREELRYRQDMHWVHCLDTSGQAFAIYLNCLYLAPLTWLFARFFIRSYLRRDERRRSSTASQKAYLSGRDAYKGVSRRLSEAFEDPQQGVEGNGDDIAVIDEGQLKEEVKKVTSATKKGMSDVLDDSRDKADLLKAKAKNQFQADLGKAKEGFDKVKAGLASARTDLSEVGTPRGITSSIAETVETMTQNIQETSRSVKETVFQSISGSHGTQAPSDQQAKSILASLSDNLKHKAKSANDTLEQISSAVQQKVKPDESLKAAKARTTDGNAEGDSERSQDTTRSEDKTSQENAQGDSERSQDTARSEDKTSEENAQGEPTEGAPQNDSVRQADSETKTPAETTTGESKPHQSSVQKSTSKENTTEDSPGKKLGEEESSSQDDGPKEHSPKNRSSQGAHAEGDVAESPVNQYDDQQSSWIHVKHDTEAVIENTVDKVQEQIENLRTDALGDRDLFKEPGTEDSQKSDASKAKDDAQATSPESPEKTDREEASNTETEPESRAEEQKVSTEDTNSKQKEGASAQKDTKRSTQAKKDEPKAGSQTEHKAPSYAQVVAEAVKEDTTESEEPSETAATEGERPSEQRNAEDTPAPAASRDTNTKDNGSSEKATESDSTAVATSSRSEDDMAKTMHESKDKDQTIDMTNTVKPTAESTVNGVKAGTEALADTAKTVTQSASDKAEQLKPGSDSPGDGTLWFEKLTTGIDSKTSGEAEKKEVDKIIDESEPVRDNIVTDTKNEKQEPEKKEVDRIIDESELVRDEVINDTKEGVQEQNTAASTDQGSSDKENNPDPAAKEHDDGA